MKKRIFYSLLIVSLIILFDQLTKYLTRTHIDMFETIRVMPLVNLVHVHNEGAAFGMFRSFGNTFFIAISITAIIFISWVIVTGKENYILFSILAGGAAGNLIDRLVFGYVVDFIDVTVSGYHWPAFNVADSMLSIGIFLMFINLLRKKG